jgi:L,D-peptidoglycan transpeptidase YkuD (ErfK/YbiS/YcfS/YnhG family)
MDPCSSVKAGTKILLGKDEVNPFQIGKVTILKKTSVFKIDGSKKIHIRSASVGEKYRVYSVQSNILGLAKGYFLVKDKKVKVENVSTKMQQAAKCVHEKNLEVASSQMLVVKAQKNNKSKATLQLYRKKGKDWLKVSSPIAAVIGKKGVGKTKEGDSLTPKGTYMLGTSFGWGIKPTGVDYPFRKVTKFDYWIDDPKSNDYNKWIQYKENPYNKWKSFERMTHPLYKYAVVIRYNDDPIVRGSGSAIFLHISTKSTRYTLGCVAVSEKDLVKILKWLNPKSKPIIKIEQ